MDGGAGNAGALRDAKGGLHDDLIHQQRFWLLDSLRGLAALSVAVFHYNHFYLLPTGKLPDNFQSARLPFNFVLHPLYSGGYHAVQLFFVVSGFVFFFVYFRSLRDASVGAWTYFTARFSRLYPLHFATLLFVAFGQWGSMRVRGDYFVYPNNDIYHFILNLFFASHWGLEAGDSFNGPIWSLSVEVVLYFLFYLYCRHIAAGTLQTVVSIIGFWLLFLGLRRVLPGEIAEIMHAAMCFLTGGLVYLVWVEASKIRRRDSRIVLAAIAVVEFLAIGTFIAQGTPPVLHFIIFPGLVLFLAILQTLYPLAGQRSHVLGDISYAAYLVHFPLQLTMVVLATSWGVTVDYDQPIVLIGFIGALVVISAIAYKAFEKPIQAELRRRMLHQR
jgi:peptidoglycan/LPS O-acetylase OafA/YrhL